jgi:hypothetical protein
VILLTAAATANCAGSVETATQPTLSAAPSATETTSPSPSASAQLLAPLSLKAAWGNPQITVINGLPDPNHVLFLSAVSPDARWALGQRRPRLVSSTERSSVVAVEVASHRTTVLHTMPGPAFQAGLTAADDRWFVWAEASQQPDFSDWTLYAYDGVTNHLSEIARAKPQPDGRYLPSSVWPQVDHGVLVWSEETATAVGALRTGQVKMVRLPDGAPEVLATGTRGAAISWPYVAWAEPTGSLNNSTRMVRLNLDTGERSPVPGADDARWVTIQGNAISWVRGLEQIWLAEAPDDPGRLVARATERDGFLDFPVMSDRFIGWSSNSFPGVYDRVLDRLVTVDTTTEPVGWHFIARGAALMWAIPNLDPQARAIEIQQGLTMPRDIAILDVTTIGH